MDGFDASKLLNNHMIVLAWAVAVIILLVFIVYTQREKFLGEFRSAPVNRQLPPVMLGIGSTSRFQEFSSTNQGGSNPIAENAASEGMMGSIEAPIFNNVPGVLDQYQASTVNTPEAFGVRQFYSDAFGNPEAKLTRVLQGL